MQYNSKGRYTMTVNRKKVLLVILNIIFGTSVLASYWHGVATNPGEGWALWGDVPRSIVPVYVANMFLAASGFFAFSFFILFKLKSDDTVLYNRFSYNLFYWIYLLILLPSAFWMPLTYVMIDSPSTGLWLAIRLILAIVGLASLAMLGALITARPHSSPWAKRFAVVGAVFFCIQTALLDAIVWTAFFPVP
jgi:hypothetical protein